MSLSTLLNFVIFLPIITAFIAWVSVKNSQLVKVLAFITTIFVSIAIFIVFINYSYDHTMQFVTQIPWIQRYGISYFIGLDGFSLVLIMLIAFIAPSLYLLLWEEKHTKGYWINLLLIQAGMSGAILSLDLVLFYFFWELMLIPVFFMILLYGAKKDRAKVVMKMFVYTVAGSLLMLVSIIYLGISFLGEYGAVSFEYDKLRYISSLSSSEAIFLFLAFLVAFGIKLPLFPLHTWLLKTYNSAPTGTLIFLSAIMAKIGLYGIIRFLIPMFPEVATNLSYYLVLIGVFGIIYFGIAALMQNNIKKMLAYGSASHLALIFAGIFSLNIYGANGALYLIFAHGLAAGGLFALVGILYYKSGFKKISQLGSVGSQAPILTIFFGLFLLSNIGLPLTVGFVGEFLLIFGVYEYSHILGYIASLTIVIGASFMIWMYGKAILADSTTNDNIKIRDLNKKEILALSPWAILVLLMGLFPNYFISMFDSVTTIYIIELTKASM
jgi:NADH-quinone oxidoreductase subunit M